MLRFYRMHRWEQRVKNILNVKKQLAINKEEKAATL